MRKQYILLSLFVLIGSFGGAVSAQTPAASPAATASRLIQGEVSSIAADKIVLQTKDGSVEVALTGKTEFKRVPPENPSLKTAVAAALTDIAVGDKLIITGTVSADNKKTPAKAVYLMSKSDIAQKQNKEREEWRARGITGRVAAVNPQTKEITVSQRGIAGERQTILSLKENANFRRYAEGSVDYNEAKNSSFDEIKVGDSIRAMGDKSEDGSTIKAEKIVSGSFQTVGGAITAIDAGKGEITINNIQTKKDVTIVVGKNSVLKQFPAEMAQRMTQFQTGGVAPGQGAVRPPQTNQAGAPQQNPNRPGAGGGMRGGGNIDDMLERFPNISITDLKIGDMIAVSSTKNANDERVNAIKLLSGVEPFIKIQQQQTATGRPRGSQEAGLSIPGLDGSNFP
ncbi:MAG TPA: hypothetical protein VNI84_07445 [Pyrinomonadaceae bacterium]|nr:hypothetical protein [Pyrinomonadaceae bacterium]